MSTYDPITVPLGPARVRRFSWLGVLILGSASYLLILRTLIRTDNPNFLPSLILLGSIVVPMTVLVFAVSGGRRIAAPPGIVIFTAIAGGVIGTVAAGTLEYDTLHRLGALPMILVGLIEEAAKLIVPLILMIFLRRPDPPAGVIIGVASGMGFATLETMGYGFSALLNQGSLAAVDETLLLRALLSPAGHVAWTGLTVAALWRIPTASRRGPAVGLAAASFVAAVLLHGAWDGFNSIPIHLVVAALSVTSLLILMRRAHRSA
ncbi:MAG TPA: PrsW family intramembrane metalloprotease [Propionibacteriaceae bacterium]|nr:PrsW family intramembrane metalloprotease [Propionibacteriaceae bacterium]